MRIAVINEFSARDKNPFIIDALGCVQADVHNVGMTAEGDGNLTYLHTGLMAAVALNSGAADFVVGGCGTGQGFMMSAAQYPGVFCGLVVDSLDAWLFSQINAGNCVSLRLNQGFGWAGEVQLRHVFQNLFRDEPGGGYPPSRSESQRASRATLGCVNAATHKTMTQILDALDASLVGPVCAHRPFVEFIARFGVDEDLKRKVCGA